MADAPLLELNDLCISAAAQAPTAKPLLQSVSLAIAEGETHLLTGARGAGKTVLAKTLLGSNRYSVDRGTVRFRGDDITAWPTDVRAKTGLFLGSPGTARVAGITVLGLLRASTAATADANQNTGFSELHQEFVATVESLGLPASLLNREVSSLTTPEEATALEVLQLLILRPDVAVFDLPSGGLTEDSVRILATGLQRWRVERPRFGTLIMSRDDRLLDLLEPDNIHVLGSGRITASDASEPAMNGTTDGHKSLS